MSPDLLALLSSYYGQTVHVPKMTTVLCISSSCTTATWPSVSCIIFSYLWITQICFRFPTNHYHHHFPWPSISLQLSPISLCPFSEKHLWRVSYTCDSPIPPLLLSLERTPWRFYLQSVNWLILKSKSLSRPQSLSLSPPPASYTHTHTCLSWHICEDGKQEAQT